MVDVKKLKAKLIKMSTEAFSECGGKAEGISCYHFSFHLNYNMT